MALTPQTVEQKLARDFDIFQVASRVQPASLAPIPDPRLRRKSDNFPVNTVDVVSTLAKTPESSLVSAGTQGTGITEFGAEAAAETTATNATRLGSLGNLAAGAAGSFAGSKLSGALVPESKASNIGSTVGGAVGTAIGSTAGPLGAAVIGFLGSTVGGLFGAIFGGERLNASEVRAGKQFKEIFKTEKNFDTALALTALNNPQTGFDSIGDGVKKIGDQDQIGSGDRSKFVRKSFFKGLENLLLDRKVPIEDIVAALKQNKGFQKADNFADPSDFAILKVGQAEGVIIARDFPDLVPLFLGAGAPAGLLGLTEEEAMVFIEEGMLTEERIKMREAQAIEDRRIKPITGNEQSTNSQQTGNELFAQIPQVNFGGLNLNGRMA